MTVSTESADLDAVLTQCEAAIGYTFRDRALLLRCLTHTTIARTRLDSNERLEFLGDAVLGLVIAEMLYQLYPTEQEGEGGAEGNALGDKRLQERHRGVG